MTEFLLTAPVVLAPLGLLWLMNVPVIRIPSRSKR